MDLIEYDVRLRGAGKTHALLEWWGDRPLSRRIAVPDSLQGRQIAERAGIPSSKVGDVAVIFDALRGGRLLRGRGDVELAIDNLDMILARMLPPNAILHRVASTGLWADPTLLDMRAAAGGDRVVDQALDRQQIGGP